ncbi:MAG: GyrI-like domain-containing protein [Cryomorphaceae bacterium]|nr:GyrI-like domain-containing protein [Cryomorphaceae bacterium]
MKVLKYIGIGLIVLVFVTVILTFAAPTDFNVERSISINAPKSIIKEQVMYFEKTKAFSPWHVMDPDMKDWMEGEDGTIGAKYYWDGNDEVGEGYQELISVQENRIEIDVTFLRPFESVAHTYFTFDENDNSVDVVWGFHSKFPRPFNIMGLFFNMEDAIGQDYEKGLISLKELAEGIAAKQGSGIELVELSERHYLGFRKRMPMDEMEAFFGEHYANLFAYINNVDFVESNGRATALYYDWDEENNEVEVTAALPITGNLDQVSLEGYEQLTLSGKAYKAVHRGSYETIEETHGMIHSFYGKHNLPLPDLVVEEYVNNPNDVSSSEELVTNIFYVEK